MGATDNRLPQYIVTAWPLGYGKGESRDLTPIVSAFTYDDNEEKADKCTLTIDNFDLSHFDNPFIACGMALGVQWGYAGNLCPERQVVIQKVKGFHTLAVEGLDKGIVLHKEQVTRTFENVTRSDVIRQIAKEAGYGDDRVFIEDTPVVYETIVQARMTNAQFMKTLANREGFEFYDDYDGLHWHPRNLGAKPIRSYRYYLDGTGDVLSISTETDITEKKAKSKAKGTDPDTGAEIKEVGDNENTNREGLGEDVALPLEVADYAVDDFGEKTEKRRPSQGLFVYPNQDLTPGERAELRRKAAGNETDITTEPTSEAAKRAADAKYRKAALKGMKMTMNVIGDPGVKAKELIELTIPNATSLSGKWYIGSVKHKLGRASGYDMDIELKRDGGKKKGASKAALNEKDAPPETFGDPNADASQLYMVNDYGEKSYGQLGGGKEPYVFVPREQKQDRKRQFAEDEEKGKK